MTFPRWIFTLVIVLAFNWSFASWLAAEQYNSNSELVATKLGQESELLKSTEKLLEECKKSADILQTEYGARRAVCDLARDRHVAILKQLNHLQGAEKSLNEERESNHRFILGLMMLSSVVLFAIFIFGFTQRRYARKVRSV